MYGHNPFSQHDIIQMVGRVLIKDVKWRAMSRVKAYFVLLVCNP